MRQLAAGLAMRSVRARFLATMLAFMAGGFLVAGALSHAVQLSLLHERVDAELRQEIDELRLIAEQQRALLGDEHPTSDLLRAATRGAAPGEHEAFLALIDGRPAFRPVEQSFDLTAAHTVELLLDHHRPGRTVLTDLEIDGRTVRVVIASVSVASDPAEGVFVAANDVSEQRARVWQSGATYALVAAGTLVLAALVGWLVAGRLLRPIEDLREATRDVTIDRLERRVPDPGTTDDVAALAHNFNRMLERLHDGYEDQRRFMSDVSHELRTPLTIMRGTLETADPEDPRDVGEAHEIALDELDRMGLLVSDLSTLARSGHPDFVLRRPVDTGEFTRAVFARIEHLGPRRWTWTCEHDMPIEIDAQRLTQALVQVAANAVRYSEPGTAVALSVTPSTLHGRPAVDFAVRDEGRGIDPADHERIFERFERVGPATGDQGSGLGLSIVRAITEAHGGIVRVDSALGRGTTFTLRIPTSAPPGPEGTAAESVGAAAASETGSRNTGGEHA